MHAILTIVFVFSIRTGLWEDLKTTLKGDSVTRKVVQLSPWGDGLDPDNRPHLGFTFS